MDHLKAIFEQCQYQWNFFNHLGFSSWDVENNINNK